jgi:hypothetical protein
MTVSFKVLRLARRDAAGSKTPKEAPRNNRDAFPDLTHWVQLVC